MTDRPRYDGLGIAMLGLVAVLLTGLAITGLIRAPAPLDDTTVQQSQAWASWAMVVVSIVAGGIGALSLYLIFRTLQAAQRSAAAAEHTLAETRLIGRAQTRAYLSVDAGGFTYGDNYSEFEITYRNAGQSPALNIKAEVSIYAVVTDHIGEEFGGVRANAAENWPSLVSGGISDRALLIDNFDLTPLMRELPFLEFATGVGCSFTVTLSYTDVFGDQHQTKASFYGTFNSGAELKKKLEFDRPH